MAELREYQVEAVEAVMKDLEAHKRALLCLFTGGGKTFTIFEIMKKHKSALFVTNKIDLAVQSMDRWKQYYGDDNNIGLCVGSKGKRELKPYTFATVQTASKLNFEENMFELVVIDETHVELQESGWYEKLLLNIGIDPLTDRHRPDLNHANVGVVGLTATPFRNGKGYIYGEGKFYPRVSYEKNIKWGVEHGFLVEPKLKAGGGKEFNTNQVGIRMGDFDIGALGQLADDDDKVTAQVADAVLRLQNSKHILWSCVNIEHADKVARMLKDNHGQTAVSYHSMTEERANVMEDIRNCKFRNVTFVSAISEGFDWIEADAIVLMRPTRSPVLAIQMIGRVLRPADNKTMATVLDYGQVIRNIGPIDNPIVRDSTKRDKKQDALVAGMMKICPECLSYIPSATRICPECDHEFLIDRLKNIDRRPDVGVDLFSRSPNARIRWMSVGDVDAVIKPSKNGNKMIQLRIKKTIFDGPFAGVLDHIVLEGWNRIKGQVKIAAYAGPLFQWSWDQPETCVRAVSNSDVVEVLVDETGKWPKILRVRKADGREIFVG